MVKSRRSQAQTTGLKRQRLEQMQQTMKSKKPKQDSEEDVEAALDSNTSNSSSYILQASPDKITRDVDASGNAGVDDDLKTENILMPPYDATKTLPAEPPKVVDRVDEEDDDRNPNADFDFVRRRREDAAGAATPALKNNPYRKATICAVQRTETIQAARLRLPIIGYEQQIMELILQNDIVIVCGETGSGKTTQVPQFLYEAGFASGDGLIGITEPRRVAAISMSRRVAEELNVASSRTVAYHIRYESNVLASETRIKFMTDGVLLRELSQDFLLLKYSCILLDEAHERSSFTDILIGLLSRIVKLRYKRDMPLKLIIMSATLRVEDFTQNERLFMVPPPVVHVQARQFDVQVHYSKRTPDNYLLAAYKKVCKIHRQLPAGTILVFVTGQQEVHTLCRWLQQTFTAAAAVPVDRFLAVKSRGKTAATSTEDDGVNEVGDNIAPKKEISLNDENAANIDSYPVEPIDEDDERFVSAEHLTTIDSSRFTAETPAFSGGSRRPFDGALLHAIDDAEEGDTDEENRDSETDEFFSGSSTSSAEPLRVLPLYSLLSTERQQQVFEPSPTGVRTCIIATNVAETSLTMPGVRYVVDCGKVKAKLHDPITGASTFSVMWTSKASAEQRAGRAGRVAPGHCYRLYSSAVFNDEFEQFTPCEIVRRPIPDLVLQMKAMHIIKVDNFPFPTPPDSDAVRAAERELIQLGALALDDEESARKAVAAARIEAVASVARTQERVSEAAVQRRVDNARKSAAAAGADRRAPAIARITPLGQAMAQIPLMPRYSKALVLAAQKAADLLPYLIAVVSALTVPEVLVENSSTASDDGDENRSSAYGKALQVLKKRWVSSSHQTLLFGDLGVLLKAVGGAEHAGMSPEWCAAHGLRYKAMREIRHLRQQLTSIVARVFSAELQNQQQQADSNKGADLLLKISPPCDAQLERMRQIMLKCVPFQVARPACRQQHRSRHCMPTDCDMSDNGGRLCCVTNAERHSASSPIGAVESLASNNSRTTREVQHTIQEPCHHRRPSSFTSTGRVKTLRVNDLPAELRRQVFGRLRCLVYRTCPDNVQQFVEKRMPLADMVDMIKRRINLTYINVGSISDASVDAGNYDSRQSVTSPDASVSNRTTNAWSISAADSLVIDAVGMADGDEISAAAPSPSAMPTTCRHVGVQPPRSCRCHADVSSSWFDTSQIMPSLDTTSNFLITSDTNNDVTFECQHNALVQIRNGDTALVQHAATTSSSTLTRDSPTASLRLADSRCASPATGKPAAATSELTTSANVPPLSIQAEPVVVIADDAAEPAVCHQRQQQARSRRVRPTPATTDRMRLARVGNGARRLRWNPNTLVVHAVTLTQNDLKDYPERPSLPKEPWMVKLSLADCVSDDEKDMQTCNVAQIPVRNAEVSIASGTFSPAVNQAVHHRNAADGVSRTADEADAVTLSTLEPDNASTQQTSSGVGSSFSDANGASASITEAHAVRQCANEIADSKSSQLSSGNGSRRATAADALDAAAIADAKSAMPSDAAIMILLERRYGLRGGAGLQLHAATGYVDSASNNASSVRSTDYVQSTARSAANRSRKYPDAVMQSPQGAALIHDRAIHILRQHYPEFYVKSRQRSCEFCHQIGLYELWPASCRFCSLHCAKRYSRYCQLRRSTTLPDDSSQQPSTCTSTAEGSGRGKRDRSDVCDDDRTRRKVPRSGVSLASPLSSPQQLRVRTETAPTHAAGALPNDGDQDRFPVDRDIVLGLENRHVESWTKEDVAQYIASFVFHVSPDVPRRFLDDCIDGQALFMLEKDMLTSTMSIPLGYALKISYAIEELRRSNGFVDVRRLRIPPSVVSRNGLE